MGECIQYKFLRNNKLIDTKLFRDDYFKQGLSLYEVIRIMDSKPVFLEKHLARLKNSANRLGQTLWYSKAEITKKIKLVVKKNGVVEGNVKIVFNVLDQTRNFYCYFVTHSYPLNADYTNGVATVVYNAERRNPEAKVYNHQLRSYTNSILDSSDIYEVILLDNLGNITEGSRSNLFFISDNKLYTAPDQDVLNGVVRAKLIEICERLNISLVKEKIPYSDLNKFDAAFLTGTSPQILPIRTMNAYDFDVNHALLSLLLESYRVELLEYLIETVD